MRSRSIGAMGAGWLLALMPLGCEEAHPQSPSQPLPPPAQQANTFDPGTAGTIRGRVIWQGELPQVEPFEIRSLVTASNPPQPRLIRENPHRPVIDPKTKAVAGAVVFLRGVDPHKSRPWHHAKVVVEQKDRRMTVLQGVSRVNIGFVRCGDAVTMMSGDAVLYGLHARGAAFFTLMFPDAGQPLTRMLSKPGIVELSSAAGHYWMRATLFVDQHPYYTLTDEQGGFEMSQVPPGIYQLVCWMPNWHKASEDRDPESGLVTRVAFQPPMQKQRDIVVELGGQIMIEVVVQLVDFSH